MSAIPGNSLFMTSRKPASRFSVLSEPTSYRSRTTRPFPPRSAASLRAPIWPPLKLLVETVLEGSVELSRESMMITGMPAAIASSTGATSARSSSGASTIADTLRPMKFSTTWICCSRSSSRRGPFQMMLTAMPLAASSRLALTAPASMDFQNSCVVPLGMTAIWYSAPRDCGEGAAAASARARMRGMRMAAGSGLLGADSLPGFSRGIAVRVERFELHRYAGAGRGGDLVAAAPDHARVHEMPVQVVDVLDHAALEGAGDADEVEDGLVLDVFAEANAPRLRADGHAELRREQQHRARLVPPAQPARIDLAVGDRPRLEQLLEDHAVLAVLARGDPDVQRGKRLCDRRVPQDFARARRLLDPQGAAVRELLHPLDGLGDVPALVRVDHHGQAGPDLGAHDRAPAPVVVHVGAHLDLEARPALGERLPAQPADLVVRVPEPPGGRRVGGIARGDDRRLPCRPRGSQPLEHVAGLRGSQGVGKVPPVDKLDDLRGRKARKQAPEGLALDLGPEIPERVDYGRRRKVDDPLFRAEPAQLAVARQVPPEGAGRAGEGL